MEDIAMAQADGHRLDAALRQAGQSAVVGIGNGAETLFNERE
jgi:hypothetical protein